MTATLSDIRGELQTLHVPSSLAFLNHVLAVSRSERKDPQLERHLGILAHPLPVFVCHFLAKQIILNSSPLGPYRLDWGLLRRLIGMCIDLEDPIVSNPEWKNADPSGFFERVLAQQIPPQNLKELREYGLALALFGDSESDFDLRGECERELQMPLEKFLQFGFLCSAATSAWQQGSVLTHDYLRQAYAAGVNIAVPEVWGPFLQRAACTPERFRQVCQDPTYRVCDERFAVSEFNPLTLYPLIEISPGRFLAPDPKLIVIRTTWGLFHDLFKARGCHFSTRFGAPFSRLVGRLLKSVCPLDRLWTDDLPSGAAGRRGDWAYVGQQRTVLIECKSARPTLELTSMASEESVEDAATRIAGALEQLIDQDAAVQRGEWIADGLVPKSTVHLVVTFGQFTTLNGPFFRRRIEKALAERGRTPSAPYVVLGIQEFDAVIHLAELGERIDEVISRLSTGTSFNPLDHYQAQLKENMISRFARHYGEMVMDIVPARIERC